MKEIRYTLLSDGPADKALIPILTWLLRQHLGGYAIQPEWADLWRLPVKPRSLPERMIRSIELYPCDILFVHRDAEKESHGARLAEIHNALEEAVRLIELPPIICVVPVRMHEAWLLFDEAAIRRASGNPNGKQSLHLPQLRRVESLPDPKKALYELLRLASGRKGRHLEQFSVSRGARQVSDFIDDFAPLRTLSAFVALETDVQNLIKTAGWAE